MGVTMRKVGDKWYVYINHRGQRKAKCVGSKAAAEKTMMVDRVDMISEACPANIQKNVPAGSMPTGTNNPPQ
ncbi:MAG TPA: hypothetical protein VN622_07080 [Clostridia bacterium]|nr:hypothetical protein [Clostridia bacterium]